MSSPADPARLRIGDHEREQAAAVLADHYAYGRISDVEHADRLDAVWSARTRADLDVLFHDLPVAGRPDPRSDPRPVRQQEGSSGPGPWLLVFAILGVVLVITKIPWILVALVVVLYAAIKHSRHRRRRVAGPAYWR